MLRTGVGFSTHSDARSAGREAAEAALAAAGRAEAALLLATPAHAAELPGLLAAASDALGTRAVVGASFHGVLAGGREHEGGPAVAVLAETGVPAEPFLIPDLVGRRGARGRADRRAAGGGAPRRGPRDRAAGSAGAAAGAAARRPGPLRSERRPWSAPAPWARSRIRPSSGAGERIVSGALAGLVLRGAKRPRIGVTQACRPATELLTVTRARGNWILELDGRPALDVYREAAGEPLAADLRRAAAHLLVALPRDAAETLAPGSYLVRNVAGFATSENAFAIPERLAPGRRIALAHRDPEVAREDLKAMLAGLAGGAPAGALYFDCCARGAGFFGVQDLEAAYLEQALGPTPLLGLFGSCEIGPIGGRTELLTYTGVLALLDG